MVQTVSVIVPVKEEERTIATLVQAIEKVFADSLVQTAQLNEIVLIDDGSRDGTWGEIEKAVAQYPFVIGVKLRRNFGKAAALQEGVGLSTGEIIITMDGDLQDDAEEIPRFLKAISEGSDLVSGWKKIRHDPLGKTLPSKLFNRVTAWVSGVQIHDFNCGFKAYRREIFDGIKLYGELHRFIPVIANSVGFRISEIPVTHHPRLYGQSKYGVKRLLKGLLDLLTVVTITKYNYRPGHLFGGIGLFVSGIGGLMLSYLTLLWILGNSIGGRPLLIISALLIMIGVQFILFGLIAELIVNLNGDGKASRTVVSEVKRHGARDLVHNTTLSK